MQDRHLCWPLPYLLFGPAVTPHFFHSRIITVDPPNLLLALAVATCDSWAVLRFITSHNS